jgi:hypothetical protein
MAVESHDLMRALDSCDLLGESIEKNACWGGAFMENLVNATQPHHMNVTRVADVGGQGQENHQDAEAGHDTRAGRHTGTEHGHGARKFKALDPNDPLYPCNMVKEHHRRACYLFQTSAILSRNNGDFRDAAQKCGTAPERYRPSCYISLGRDANSWASGNPRDAIAHCTVAPAAGQPYCIIGLVTNAITADANDGFAVCRMVMDRNKPACYLAVGQQIGLLHPDPPGRERACRAVDPGYVHECRRGAGLPLGSVAGG